MQRGQFGWVGFVCVAAAAATMPGCTCQCGGGGCADECQGGTTRCAGNLVETCLDVDDDVCLEYGAPTGCGPGLACSFGACTDPNDCIDECTNGESTCAGDAVQICASDHDSDACLDLGPPTLCGLGDTCSNGICGSSCTDECASGALSCGGTTALRFCGDWDSDPCNDWSPPTPCPGGQLCTGMGVCMNPTCSDECDPGTFKSMCLTGTFSECVTDADADPCTEEVDTPCTECMNCGTRGPTIPPECMLCCCPF